jgi:hypothetical protein
MLPVAVALQLGHGLEQESVSSLHLVSQTGRKLCLVIQLGEESQNSVQVHLQ